MPASAAVPVLLGGSAGLVAAVRRFGGKLTRKSSISWENWHNLVGKVGGIVDQHQRQVSIGTKPPKTQQFVRSNQGQFRAIFCIFENFLKNFFGGVGVKSVATKELLIPYDKG